MSLILFVCAVLLLICCAYMGRTYIKGKDIDDLLVSMTFGGLGVLTLFISVLMFLKEGR